MFTTKDYDILKNIMDRNNRIKGLSLGDGTTIQELVDKTQLSEKKVRTTIKKFIEAGYITEALKKERAKSYMLTKVGMAELKKTRINIFDEKVIIND